MIWSSERSPISERPRKRLLGCSNDQFHRSPTNLKQQKIDVTTKSPEYFDTCHPRHASAETLVLALPSRADFVKEGSVDQDLSEQMPRTSGMEVDSPAILKGTNSYNVAASEDRSEGYGETCKPVQARRDYVCNIEGAEGDEVCNLTPNESNSFPSNERSLDECRKKVFDVLEHFKEVYNKLLEETKAKGGVPTKAASFLRKQQKWILDKPTFGNIPGVKVGDIYQFRAELTVVGLHLQYVASIDYTDFNGKSHATSIVDSGQYGNKVKSIDTLVYVGSGANPKGSSSYKKLEDQKLEKGNLALKNSMDAKLPIRVICLQKALGMSGQGYIYAGLYIVSNYKQERDKRGKLIFKFELRRLSGQPNLSLPMAWDWEPIESTKGEGGVKNRVVVDDVSHGKEKFPIPAVNDIDDEKPPPFGYINKMIYPSWFRCRLTKFCNCKNGCSDSKPCSCTRRDGGEIPFNDRGFLCKAKPVIYECGPSCKCPPSCENRVSQNGPKYQLEVFKTTSRGWGVRSRDKISSGSFICEYVGELLDEKEAEKRIGSDEYLFDIGTYDKEEDMDIIDIHRKDNDGFTIDAVRLGNVGRFINHSCAPNLYVQNVLFDHDDKRAPHLMLFAQEDIPPMQELTYDYNYKIDNIGDENGNLRKKDCYCGFTNCIGRLY